MRLNLILSLGTLLIAAVSAVLVVETVRLRDTTDKLIRLSADLERRSGVQPQPAYVRSDPPEPTAPPAPEGEPDGVLGLRTSDVFGHVGTNPRHAILVRYVDPGSPADRAGLKSGDVLTAAIAKKGCGGQAECLSPHPIPTRDQLIRFYRAAAGSEGDWTEILIDYCRGEEFREATFPIAIFKDHPPAAESPPEEID